MRRSKSNRRSRRKSFCPTEQYLAGFFDGEGSVILAKTGAIMLQMTSTTHEVLEKIQEEFGGSLCQFSYSLKGRMVPCWIWRVGGEAALELVKRIRPYCLVKGEEMDLLQQYRKLPRERRAEKRSEFQDKIKAVRQKNREIPHAPT